MIGCDARFLPIIFAFTIAVNHSHLVTETVRGDVNLDRNQHHKTTDPRVSPANEKGPLDVVEAFLRLVEKYERDIENCTAGTEYNLGDGVVQQYGKQRFRSQAILAVNRANLLTEQWKLANERLHSDEQFFFSQVVNLAQSDEDIFAAGTCFDHYEFKDYELFCPYAYRLADRNQILVKDLSLEYPYLGETVEWFHQAKQNAQLLLAERNLTTSFRRMRHGLDNSSEHGDIVNVTSVLVSYEDGHWSKPYFDCGGGNIWMMTYSVPFFGYKNGTFYFKGTSGIDIDLQKVDIDQCEQKEEDLEKNVFANSSKCHLQTTQCMAVEGLGFRRGSYKCICKPGFYYPEYHLPAEHRFFNGIYAEEEYEKFNKGLASKYKGLQCLPCAAGCDVCSDASPCVITLDWTLRTCIIVASCAVMCFIPAIACFIFKYRGIKVLKAASPKLLYLILVGAVFLYCPMIVMYFDATEVTCSLKLWLRELGFSISYGALLLKTWRISVVFRVRSATRVKITDKGLIKRLGLLVAIFMIFLTARMIWGRPQVIAGTHKDGLKAYQCSFDVWDHCQAAGELCFLIWGIRLCIVVRKAPSEFNESRFISWAIYNETLLSIFLNLALLFLQSPANPDLLYIVHFIHTNLTTTVTLVFLFISKAYLIFKLLKKQRESKGSNGRSGEFKFSKRLPNDSSEQALTDSSLAGESNGLNWREVEEELKRVYTELERLKVKQMRVGNPHIKSQPSPKGPPIKQTVQHAYTQTQPSTNTENGFHAGTTPQRNNVPLSPAGSKHQQTSSHFAEQNGSRVLRKLVVNLDDLTNATTV